MTKKEDEILKLCSSIKSDTEDLREKFDALKQSVESKTSKLAIHEDKLSSIEMKLNHLEQHSRNFSLRIFGLKLDQETSRHSNSTAKVVYESVLTPILMKAVESGTLPSIPPLHRLIEQCHILKTSKSKDSTPVICRFQVRMIRDLVFTHKKTVLSDPQNKLEHISIVEDLTSLNYKKLQGLRKDNIQAWSLGGNIFYLDKKGVKKQA